MAPSGLAGRITSAAAALPSSAVRTVKTPIAALASSARRLSAGRTNTSQKRSICRSEAPSRRRSVPNVSPSSPCARRSASRTRTTPSRSRAGRWPVAEDRERRAADRGDARVLADHGQREALPPVGAALADPVEEAQVLLEAAERDVLPVVRRRRRVAVALGQRLDGAAERRARLEQRHLVAAVDELERGGEPGQAAADDGDLHGARPSPRPPALRTNRHTRVTHA